MIAHPVGSSWRPLRICNGFSSGSSISSRRKEFSVSGIGEKSAISDIRIVCSGRRRHTRFDCDWSSDVCVSDLATREPHIEDTALKTNLEAAEEIARQLRLRDLAGLIVIDFIDMDEKRNNRAVERRLKECLRHDRARIQVGHISHFGLLEMSRQRIRSSVLESSTEKCSHCGGTGHVRSVSSVVLQLLRALEEMLLKGATHNLTVRTRSDIALYLLNHKRAHLRTLEERFRITILVSADATVGGQVSFVIERGEQVHS